MPLRTCIFTGELGKKLQRRKLQHGEDELQVLTERWSEGRPRRRPCIPELVQNEEGEICSPSGLCLGKRDEKADASRRHNRTLLRHIRNRNPPQEKIQVLRGQTTLRHFEYSLSCWNGGTERRLIRCQYRVRLGKVVDMINKRHDAGTQVEKNLATC